MGMLKSHAKQHHTRTSTWDYRFRVFAFYHESCVKSTECKLNEEMPYEKERLYINYDETRQYVYNILYMYEGN